MRRFFGKPENINTETVKLIGQDAHHIANVLRLKVSDAISVSDGIDKIYEVKLTEVSKDRVVGDIISTKKVECPAIRLTVFQGLPKAKKMDFIVEKLTEIGVARIVPVAMARSVAEYNGARGDKKLERWRTIAAEAAKQAKRVTVPEIGEIMSFEAAVLTMKAFDKVIVPWEEEAETAPKLIDVIPSSSLVIPSSSLVIPNECEESDQIPRREAPRDDIKGEAPRDDSRIQSIGLVIGPEGGIEQAEIDALMKIDAVTVTLGKTILRTETAGLVASALILLGSGERGAGSSGSG